MADAALTAAWIPQLTLLGQGKEAPEEDTDTEGTLSGLSSPTSTMKKTFHFFKKEESHLRSKEYASDLNGQLKPAASRLDSTAFSQNVGADPLTPLRFLQLLFVTKKGINTKETPCKVKVGTVATV